MTASFDSIARLASLDLQRRFISRATPEEYWVPEEILDHGWSDVARSLHESRFRERLSPEARSALEALHAVMEREGPKVDLANADLVEADAAWAAIRAAAQECLGALGFDIRRWELSEAGQEKTRH